jgi:hypothetical protein
MQNAGSARHLSPLGDFRGIPADELISRLERYLSASAQRAILWYRKKKRAKQLIARVIHFVSLIALIAGGLCPLIPETLISRDLTRTGYLFLAFAGGLLMFDRLFGLSQSWMCYIVAAQQLEARFDRLRIDWLQVQVGDAKLVDESISNYSKLAIDFLNDMHFIISRETENWVSDFRGNISSLDQMLAKGPNEASRRTGARSHDKV